MSPSFWVIAKFLFRKFVAAKGSESSASWIICSVLTSAGRNVAIERKQQQVAGFTRTFLPAPGHFKARSCFEHFVPKEEKRRKEKKRKMCKRVKTGDLWVLVVLIAWCGGKMRVPDLWKRYTGAVPLFCPSVCRCQFCFVSRFSVQKKIHFLHTSLDRYENASILDKNGKMHFRIQS